jgi:tetratricopeptide (TPR) repeat protein
MCNVQSPLATRPRILILLPILAACAAPDPFPLPEGPPGVQAVSLFGDSLTPPAAPDSLRAAQRRQLDSAHAAVRGQPDDPDALIWLGRRLAYLGYYREAIGVYTAGLAAHPEDARFLRHRGHRRLTVRDFPGAADDFARAAKLVQGASDVVEPDGQPNARGIPTSTLRFNIWYHLGLAHFLQGDLPRARSAWEQCLAVSTNPDAMVAASYWLHHVLRRMGEAESAARVLEAISPGMDIIENTAYHRLLLLFRGDGPLEEWRGMAAGDAVDNATQGFGVGHWLLVNGDTAAALEAFRAVRRGPQWAAFGYLAAEAELARHGSR